MAGKANAGWFFAGAFLLILALTAFFVLNPPRHAPAGPPGVPPRIRQDLLMLTLSLSAYLRDGGSFAPDGRRDNGAVTRALRGGNAGKEAYLWIQPGRLVEDCYVDLWQRPYVIWTFSSEDGALNMGLPAATRVWVYTVGPNGVDEQGRGDDISLPALGRD